MLGAIYATRYLDGAVSFGLLNSAIGIGLAAGSITALLFPPARVDLVLCLAAIPEALLLTGMAASVPLLSFPLSGHA
ncbi:hypothetical protein E1292_49655 [Nonomuraea deserti]|uniref:Uncharacterized protein n=1 Tax=Nonomuraea deserti TaxID=1848322 RepID=A0A4R4TZ26_9ACTN|nr:hypothetical protein [Nonomuraea deserti]TDC84048.1 hypothetical protein E1292_49655 [Nonomuraea deserti]